MDYLITMDDGSQVLAHHGTKGMHWGVWNSETAARYAGAGKTGNAAGGGGGILLDNEYEKELEYNSKENEFSKDEDDRPETLSERNEQQGNHSSEYEQEKEYNSRENEYFTDNDVENGEKIVSDLLGRISSELNPINKTMAAVKDARNDLDIKESYRYPDKRTDIPAVKDTTVYYKGKKILDQIGINEEYKQLEDDRRDAKSFASRGAWGHPRTGDLEFKDDKVSGRKPSDYAVRVSSKGGKF